MKKSLIILAFSLFALPIWAQFEIKTSPLPYFFRMQLLQLAENTVSIRKLASMGIYLFHLKAMEPILILPESITSIRNWALTNFMQVSFWD